MNRLLLLAAMLLAAAVATAQPRVTLPEQEHDFGIIREADGLAECRFALVNTGDAPLVIRQIRANCGCTTPRFARTAVAPGDTTWVEVAYDPDGRPGRFHKKVFIDTNADPSQCVVSILGSVIGSEATISKRYPYELGKASLRDRFVILGFVGQSEAKGSYVEGYNTSSDTIRPYVTDVSPLISVVTKPAVVPPGEQYIYSIVLSADKRGNWGPVTSSFVAHPDRGSAEAMPIEVTCNIRETFASLTPEQRQKAPRLSVAERSIDLGRLSRSTGKPVTTEIKITNRGESPLKIRRVYTTDPSVNLSLKSDTVKKGKSTTLTVTVDPSRIEDPKILNASIDIIANDPDSPVTSLRLLSELLD